LAASMLTSARIGSNEIVRIQEDLL